MALDTRTIKPNWAQSLSRTGGIQSGMQGINQQAAQNSLGVNPWAVGIMNALGSGLSTYDTAKSNVQKGEFQNRISEALGSSGSDYRNAAKNAMEGGDQDLAMQYAKLADSSESRQQDVAYRNAMLGLEGQKLNISKAKETADQRKQFMKENGGTLNAINAINGLTKNADALMPVFDKDFKSEEDYAKQSGAGRWLSKLGRSNVAADPEELAARNQFAADKDQSVILLRQQMAGQGQITDYETRLLDRASKASNPYEFKTILNQIKDGLQNKLDLGMAASDYQPGVSKSTDKSKVSLL